MRVKATCRRDSRLPVAAAESPVMPTPVIMFMRDTDPRTPPPGVAPPPPWGWARPQRAEARPPPSGRSLSLS